MKNILLSLLFSFCPSIHSSASAAGGSSPEDAVIKALDAWHGYAAEANEEKYFGAMAASMVFLGTDPGERWTKEQFRAYAHPPFSKGKGWDMKASRREVFFSKDKKTAWFDEDVESKGLGAVRGSGVMVNEKGRWLVAQYNLSLPILNERFDDLRKLNVKRPDDKNK